MERVSKPDRGLSGTITIPADKSISHRAVMFSSLAKGKCKIKNFSNGADCISTLNIFKQLGTSIEYIDEHIKEYINMLAIVEHCHLSQQYLLRLFKDQMKMSALDYIQCRKMLLAKWYLYFEEYSTLDVASKLGYGDVGYFSKVFKKYEGMTPHQYKVNVRGKSA